ncbi:hypothetical protein ACIGEL_08650 [Rossellomorea aquimaris]|uniref:hypothetical protein n=1 Tax=Rossellomorea aquimaris TaxID=189382 RepID=UPI0037CA32FB
MHFLKLLSDIYPDHFSMSQTHYPELQTYVFSTYESNISTLIDTLESFSDELQLQLNENHYILECDYVIHFLYERGIDLFIAGFSLGVENAEENPDPSYKHSIADRVHELLELVKKEASTLMSEEEVECYTMASYKAFEIGTEYGEEVGAFIKNKHNGNTTLELGSFSFLP